MGPAVGFQPIHLTAEETIELAREVEERGFASAWTIEFEFDTLPYDHAMAMATRMIVVGSAIARSYARHPLSFAETAAAIDQFVPGRFVIGVGTAAARIVNPETAIHRWGVAAGSPARRMEEYIDVMRLALTGEPDAVGVGDRSCDGADVAGVPADGDTCSADPEDRPRSHVARPLATWGGSPRRVAPGPPRLMGNTQSDPGGAVLPRPAEAHQSWSSCSPAGRSGSAWPVVDRLSEPGVVGVERLPPGTRSPDACQAPHRFG